MAGGLKEVRERIVSVKNTQQITKAMKMVAAAKLRRAQQAITQLRPYAEKQNAMLKNILSNLGGEADISFGKEREVKNACMVVVTSNRGLCGAFNSNIIKAANAVIKDQFADLEKSGGLKILPIGKKANDFYRKRYPENVIINDHVMLFEDLSFANVSQVARRLMTAFAENEFDSIYVSYGKFKNAATQFAMTEKFLPVTQAAVTEENGNTSKANYIFEPNMEQLLEHLVPSILQSSFQKYVLDTHASEHGARMTAMDKASENADELLKELKLSYNKARQEAITKEILEIVGGAAALEGG